MRTGSATHAAVVLILKYVAGLVVLGCCSGTLALVGLIAQFVE